MADNSAYINHTKKWLSDVVIGHNLCPFAKREYDNETIHYAVIEAIDLEAQLEQIILHCAALDNDKNRETSLLIFPVALPEFEDYLNLLDMAAALLKAHNYEGVYQLASFHPNYCFGGVSPDDPSHYTNRSPYPMVHILREARVTAALEYFPNPENIPARNVKLTRALGLKHMKALLAACVK